MSNGASDGWTRAAMVVGGVARRDDAILLVHEHTLGGEGPDQWVLPGGRVEPGELLDVAVKREVEEETRLTVKSVGSLAFGTQHYAPGRGQPLLFLAFNVDLRTVSGDRLMPDDPDDLIIDARFVPVAQAIDLVLSAGVFPGSQSTADYLRQQPGSGPTFSLWDLNQSTAGSLARLPATWLPAAPPAEGSAYGTHDRELVEARRSTDERARSDGRSRGNAGPCR